MRRRLAVRRRGRNGSAIVERDNPGSGGGPFGVSVTLVPRVAITLLIASLWHVGGAPNLDAATGGGAPESVAFWKGAASPVIGEMWSDPVPPAYYVVSLVRTPHHSGMGSARGVGELLFAPSPFGISLTADGSYLYRLRLTLEGLPVRRNHEYQVWITTPEVDRVESLGSLSGDGTLLGEVSWNKFVIVVTLEPTTADGAERGAKEMWTGPIVMRGMSRSGKMHSMAGHDPFQDQESCAAYGYEAVSCR